MAVTDAGNYMELLASQPARGVAIDVLVVPTARPTEHISVVSELAAKTLTPLVALSSKEASPDDIAAELSEKPDLQWAVIDVPEDYHHQFMDFSAADCIPEAARPSPPSDLSLKRNIGMYIGRQFGHRLFFIDDDIQISPAQLDHAGRLLEDYGLAGLRSLIFADKSVLGRIEHERRPKRTPYRPGRQLREDIFLSGSALGVNLDKVNDHFPDIYNEDWLFMFNSVIRSEAVSAGEAWQLPYTWLLEARAKKEEFGDTIADGIYDACLNDQTSQLVRTRYWEQVIDERRNRIGRMRDGRRPRVDSVLRAALSISNIITPELCAEYIESWNIDRMAWKARLAKVPSFKTLHDRLAAIDLPVYAASSEFSV